MASGNQFTNEPPNNLTTASFSPHIKWQNVWILKLMNTSLEGLEVQPCHRGKMTLAKTIFEDREIVDEGVSPQIGRNFARIRYLRVIS